MITPTLDVSPEDYPAAQFRTLAPKRPAHLAESQSILARAAESHVLARGVTECPSRRRGRSCWVCDREPGRHVAVA